MIVGIGIDLVDVARVERALEAHGDAFLERVFTAGERRTAARRRGAGLAMHLAGRFAAKEAALKALGTGLAAGIRWTDVEVVVEAEGHVQPRLALHAAAAERLAAIGGRVAHLSITHTAGQAAAVVVLERNDDAGPR